MPDIAEAESAAGPPPDVRLNTYDAVPYSVGAFPQTHPDRLATVATLFGLKPVDPDACRVLELGCAAGGNLIPMALGSPRSNFVGIDLSSRQIDDGNQTIRSLELTNIQLRQQDILAFDLSDGPYDYILAHGVFSWVPPVVQDKILQICRRCLAPDGVAYISYNTYPGWHARGAIREMLWYHTQSFNDPDVRIQQARALLAFLAKSTFNTDGGYGSLLREELALLLRVPDTYLLHEHLEEFNEPFYFHQFAQRAAEHTLQYLGESHVAVMIASRFGAETEQTLRKISPDLLHMEQYMDFLRNRMFRQSLLCHAHQKPDFTLRPESVRTCYVSSPAANVSEKRELISNEPETFRRTQGGLTLTTHDPLMKAAMAQLEAHWPAAIAFDALLESATARLGRAATDADRASLAARILNCFTSGLIDLSVAPSRFTTNVSVRPVASPYVRLCAQRGSKVTSMRLESAELGQASRLLLTCLDGHHDRASLLKRLRSLAPDPDHADRDKLEALLDHSLNAFARAAMLVG